MEKELIWDYIEKVYRDDKGKEYERVSSLPDGTLLRVKDIKGQIWISADGGHFQLVPFSKDSSTDDHPELPGIESTLAERGKRYGSFEGQALAIRSIMSILITDRVPIPADCHQAAEMIVVKLVRAMRGDPEHVDNWHDIAGYATLVEKRLSRDPA